VTTQNNKPDDVVQTSLTALHRKLELRESAVLVADREPVKQDATINDNHVLGGGGRGAEKQKAKKSFSRN
jgi:hypothetical protein